MKIPKLLAGSALLMAGALALGGCSGQSESADGSVTMTFWHNSTTGEGKQYWEDTVEAFEEENPDVTIKIQAIQNEDMDGKLQTALNSGDAPDIFLARGGGKLAAVVEAGQAKDITDGLTQETKSAIGEAAFSALSINGKIYGLPVSVLPGGVYYSKDLFEKAGISDEPTTMDELNDAVDKLKDADITPIALGAKDAWPAAHWYYFFALRECSQKVMTDASTEPDFDDSCWLKAGEDLEDFAGTKPFNEGYLTTSAQQGAGSSAGLVANHKAAMELMGAWDPGVIQSLTPDGKPLEDLGWFPFPELSSGQGAEGALMGGVDGFTCSVDAPDACVDFLNFVAGKKNQEEYAKAFVTVPASQEAQGAVEDPALQQILSAYNDAPYVTVWLDTALGQNAGNALNVAVVNLLAGKGTPQDIVDSVAVAVKKG